MSEPTAKDYMRQACSEFAAALKNYLLDELDKALLQVLAQKQTCVDAPRSEQAETPEDACKRYILDRASGRQVDEAPSGGIYGLPTNDQLRKLRPIGEIEPIRGTCRPGYLPCDGSEVLICDYPELYAVIGNVYGTAKDCASFKIPDWRGGFMPLPPATWAIKAKEVQP